MLNNATEILSEAPVLTPCPGFYTKCSLLGIQVPMHKLKPTISCVAQLLVLISRNNKKNDIQIFAPQPRHTLP